MPYKITDNCISCGDCMVACEKNAIDDGYAGKSKNRSFFSPSFRILESTCDECGACVEVCPSEAIIKE